MAPFSMHREGIYHWWWTLKVLLTVMTVMITDAIVCNNVQCTKIRVIDSASLIGFVYQRNQWLHSRQGFINSIDMPWLQWSWIIDCEPSYLNLDVFASYSMLQASVLSVLRLFRCSWNYLKTRMVKCRTLLWNGNHQKFSCLSWNM